MPGAESRYPAHWLRIAEKDLGRVSRMLAGDDPEAAGFYLQQAVEKFLKAFLLQKGWSLRRTHDLQALLNEALAYDPSLETFREACRKISGFYIVERYPFLAEAGLTEDEVRQALGEVEGLIEKLRASVGAA
ncbi:MAG: HEPN domain-containing protein [Deltaproteobacteria bacterium]|nr:HEPN domain-containing protein [Deltaproteobacteria bacterium]